MDDAYFYLITFIGAVLVILGYRKTMSEHDRDSADDKSWLQRW
jgi:hypothetical protein